VVSNASNINSVAGNSTNINSVAGSITNVNTVATNLASVNNFADVYRIASSAPTSSLDIGDLYFDTTSDTLKVYGASGWQSAGSSINGTSQRYHYDISGTPTSVTGADANGNTLSYDAGYVDVYVNGVRMSQADITVTSGDTVTFTEALADGDEVDIVGYGTFAVASLNADNLDSGTVPSARVSGAYTGITSVGTLTSFASTGIDDNASSTAMTLDGSGNLLVGTTDAAVGVGNTNTGSSIGASGYQAISRTGTSGQATLFLNKNSNDGDLVQFNKDGTTVGSIGTVSNRLYMVEGNTGFSLVDTGNAIYPAESDGTNRDNAIDLGASGARWKDLFLSGGVYLGGTGSANYLDDYEEGTWTPVMSTSSGSSGSATFSDARYTKVGGVVYINCVIANIDTSGTTAAAQIRITGLPFTIGYVSSIGAALTDNVTYQGGRTQLNVYFDSSDIVLFRQSGNSASDTTLDYGDIDAASSDILFSGFYYTAQ
jgi:hypothetical protein